MHAYICVCVLKCVHAEHACVYAGNGWTEDGGMGGFKSVHVHVCDTTCVSVTLCARMD